MSLNPICDSIVERVILCRNSLILGLAKLLVPSGSDWCDASGPSAIRLFCHPWDFFSLGHLVPSASCSTAPGFLLFDVDIPCLLACVLWRLSLVSSCLTLHFALPPSLVEPQADD